MVMGKRVAVDRKATSSSRKVNHSGSKVNAAGRRVTYREVLGATAIGTRKMVNNAEQVSRLRGV